MGAFHPPLEWQGRSQLGLLLCLGLLIQKRWSEDRLPCGSLRTDKLTALHASILCSIPAILSFVSFVLPDLTLSHLCPLKGRFLCVNSFLTCPSSPPIQLNAGVSSSNSGLLSAVISVGAYEASVAADPVLRPGGRRARTSSPACRASLAS